MKNKEFEYLTFSQLLKQLWDKEITEVNLSIAVATETGYVAFSICDEQRMEVRHYIVNKNSDVINKENVYVDGITEAINSMLYGGDYD